MKLLSSLLNRNLLALAALTCALGPQTLRADAQCPLQNATMNGSYVAAGTGVVAGLGPITTVGLIVYNGDGTGTVASSTATVNGASSTSSNVPITFTVNHDCTGFKTIGTGPGATQMNFVVTPDGNTITWIVTNTGVTMMGTGIRLKR